jgi:carbon-monoxide dehydrogenase medium subunit
MFAAPFDYYRAGSIADAQQLLQQHPGAKLLAGGHSLIPLLKLRLAAPAALVDIGRIADLKGISTSGANGTMLRIGALTTHAELASSETLKASCPILAEAAAMVGDTQVRNAGTIGGNIAHADPASDLPAVLLALDARIHSVGPGGERAMPAGTFFQGMMTTALEPDEILTAIEVPTRQDGEGMAYVKFRHPASGYAVIGVAAIIGLEHGSDNLCTGARIAIGGLLPAPRRCETVEQSIAGQRITFESVQRAAGEVSAMLDGLGDEVMGDIFASAEYRQAVAPVYVGRAIEAASTRT